MAAAEEPPTQGRDTASPRSAMWGEELSQQPVDVPCSITNSPVHNPEPSLSEAASEFVKKEVGGGGAVMVAPADGKPLGPPIDLDELLIMLDGDSTLLTSSESMKLLVQDMLVTPAGSKKAVQFNTEADQVSSRTL